MLTIRLQRIGKKKKPSYRIIVSEKKRDPQAPHLEMLGIYDPVQKNKVLNVNKERVQYWIEKGATLSNTINNLFVKEGIIEGKKKKSVAISKTRQAKLEEKKKAAKEAEAKAAEQKAAEAQAAKAAKEAEAAAAAQAKAAEAAKEQPAEMPAETAAAESAQQSAEPTTENA